MRSIKRLYRLNEMSGSFGYGDGHGDYGGQEDHGAAMDAIGELRYIFDPKSQMDDARLGRELVKWFHQNRNSIIDALGINDDGTNGSDEY